MSQFYRLFVLFSVFILSLSSQAQSPAVEVRAVWLSTNWNLDWPSSSNISMDAQKKEFCDILDQLQNLNINTVFFQVRLRGNVFYKSNIESWSPFYTWAKNIDRASDPLSFAVEECHKRGLECHAWFVVYPLGTKKRVERQPNSIVKKMPSICKLHRGNWYLDPGNPKTQTYILSLVNEIVDNYDIDGLNLDYVRYPDDPEKFPDKKTFEKYGRGWSLSDWRRNNVTNLISAIYADVKAIKPWVQVSSSPLGRYKPLTPNDVRTAYFNVYQDAGKWLQMGKQDAIYPMMYHQDDLFYPYADDWVKNANGRIVVPGLGVYRLLPGEGDWDVSSIANQIDFIRKRGMSGEAYFRTGNILNNVKGILPLIKNYYPYPAKLPPMIWLKNTPPDAPKNLQIYRTEEGLTCISWNVSKKNESLTYTLYACGDDHFDPNNSSQIIATGLRHNKIYLNIPNSETGTYYAVSASDRYHNESPICFSAYFVHSKEEK